MTNNGMNVQQTKLNKFSQYIGKTFNDLTILDVDNYTNDKHERFCTCQCSCGVIKKIRLNFVLSGHTKSCGCAIKKSKNFKDITGQRFGKLIVLGPSEYRNSDGSIKWKCQCDCGTITYVRGADLRNGHTYGCGCTRSWGEQQIANTLNKNGIIYKKEYKFNGLKDINNLLFDFAIFSNNNKLLYLIECQGSQHYNQNNNWYQDKMHQHDLLKKEFCLKNNIPLVEIKYNDGEKLSEEYILTQIKSQIK